MLQYTIFMLKWQTFPPVGYFILFLSDILFPLPDVVHCLSVREGRGKRTSYSVLSQIVLPAHLVCLICWSWELQTSNRASFPWSSAGWKPKLQTQGGELNLGDLDVVVSRSVKLKQGLTSDLTLTVWQYTVWWKNPLRFQRKITLPPQ